MVRTEWMDLDCDGQTQMSIQVHSGCFSIRALLIIYEWYWFASIYSKFKLTASIQIYHTITWIVSIGHAEPELIRLLAIFYLLSGIGRYHPIKIEHLKKIEYDWIYSLIHFIVHYKHALYLLQLPTRDNVYMTFYTQTHM